MEKYESFGQAIKRVPMGSTTFLLESEKKIWSSPPAWLTLGKSTQAVRSSGCALWCAGQKNLSVNTHIAIIDYGKSIANQLVSFLC